jgi:hypothetical protein
MDVAALRPIRCYLTLMLREDVDSSLSRCGANTCQVQKFSIGFMSAWKAAALESIEVQRHE